MAEVKVDLTGQVAQFDVTLMFTGDEALDTITGAAIEKVVPVDQFVTYGLKITAQLVKVVPPAPAPAPTE